MKNKQYTRTTIGFPKFDCDDPAQIFEVLLPNINTREYIFSLTFADLKNIFPEIPSYRYSQIINWIYKNHCIEPDKMTNLPGNIKNKLIESFICRYPEIIKQSKTSDKTDKFLIKLADNETIEFVVIDSPQRKTLCLSSQVGCPVQCRFCASGMYGLKRNLNPGEIIAQFLLATEKLGKYPDNVVFMGIGEPLLNYKNLISSLEILCSPEYIGYAARRITISTSGIPGNIYKLADLAKQWNLALSLHATNDSIRSELIPDQCRFKLQEIINACRYYYSKTGRIITLEYTLIKGVNDSREQAGELAAIAKGLKAKINLIPFNTVKGSGFLRPEKKVCLEFTKILEKHGSNVTLRLEKGSNIDAACGQLRASYIDNNRVFEG